MSCCVFGLSSCFGPSGGSFFTPRQIKYPAFFEGLWYTSKIVRQIWAEWAVCHSSYLWKGCMFNLPISIKWTQNSSTTTTNRWVLKVFFAKWHLQWCLVLCSKKDHLGVLTWHWISTCPSFTLSLPLAATNAISSSILSFNSFCSCSSFFTISTADRTTSPWTPWTPLAVNWWWWRWWWWRRRWNSSGARWFAQYTFTKHVRDSF